MMASGKLFQLNSLTNSNEFLHHLFLLLKIAFIDAEVELPEYGSCSMLSCSLEVCTVEVG